MKYISFELSNGKVLTYLNFKKFHEEISWTDNEMYMTKTRCNIFIAATVCSKLHNLSGLSLELMVTRISHNASFQVTGGLSTGLPLISNTTADLQSWQNLKLQDSTINCRFFHHAWENEEASLFHIG